jgi:hypothetical protein
MTTCRTGTPLTETRGVHSTNPHKSPRTMEWSRARLAATRIPRPYNNLDCRAGV